MLAVTCIYTLLKARSHNFVKYYFGLRIRTHVQIHVKYMYLYILNSEFPRGKGITIFFVLHVCFFKCSIFKLLLIYILNHFVKWNFMAYLFYRYFKDNFNLCVNLMFIYTWPVHNTLSPNCMLHHFNILLWYENYLVVLSREFKRGVQSLFHLAWVISWSVKLSELYTVPTLAYILHLVKVNWPFGGYKNDEIVNCI